MHLHNCVNEGRIYVSTTKNEKGQYETAVFPRKVVDMVWAYAIYEVEYDKCLHVEWADSLISAIWNHIKCVCKFGITKKHMELNQ